MCACGDARVVPPEMVVQHSVKANRNGNKPNAVHLMIVLAILAHASMAFVTGEALTTCLRSLTIAHTLQSSAHNFASSHPFGTSLGSLSSIFQSAYGRLCCCNERRAVYYGVLVQSVGRVSQGVAVCSRVVPLQANVRECTCGKSSEVHHFRRVGVIQAVIAVN